MVAWSGAVQAQDFTSAKLSLGLRLRPTTDRIIHQAFEEGRILRTHVMRPTWHFVTPADIRWMLNLTSPRIHQINSSIYRQVGLDDVTLARSAEIMAGALQGRRQLTRPELGEVVAAQGIADVKGLRLTAMAMWAELEALTCSGPRRGKQSTYMLLDERAPNAPTLHRDEARCELLLRFFQSHGPATAQDFSRRSGLTLTDTRDGLADLAIELQQEDIDGQSYWLMPITSLPPAEPSAYLVSIYDEYTIGYKDFGAHVDTDLSGALRDMGNALQNVILIDGQVRGTWRRTVDA